MLFPSRYRKFFLRTFDRSLSITCLESSFSTVTFDRSQKIKKERNRVRERERERPAASARKTRLSLIVYQPRSDYVEVTPSIEKCQASSLPAREAGYIVPGETTTLPEIASERDAIDNGTSLSPRLAIRTCSVAAARRGNAEKSRHARSGSRLAGRARPPRAVVVVVVAGRASDVALAAGRADVRELRRVGTAPVGHKSCIGRVPLSVRGIYVVGGGCEFAGARQCRAAGELRRPPRASARARLGSGRTRVSRLDRTDVNVDSADPRRYG